MSSLSSSMERNRDDNEDIIRKVVKTKWSAWTLIISPLLHTFWFLLTVFGAIVAILGLVSYTYWQPFLANLYVAPSSGYVGYDNPNPAYPLDINGTLNAQEFRLMSNVGTLAFGNLITVSQIPNGLSFQTINGGESLLTLYNNGSLFVPGTLMFSGQIPLTANFTQAVSFGQNVYANQNLVVDGNTSIAGNLNVNGLALFNDNALFEQNITIQGKLSAQSIVSVSEVDSNLLVNGALTVNDLATFNGGLSVTNGNVNIPAGSYYQIGGTNILGGPTAYSSATLTTSTTIQGQLLAGNPLGAPQIGIEYDPTTGYPSIFGIAEGAYFDPIQIGMSGGASIGLLILNGSLLFGYPSTVVIDSSRNIYGTSISSSGGITVTGGNINIPVTSFYQIGGVDALGYSATYGMTIMPAQTWAQNQFQAGNPVGQPQVVLRTDPTTNYPCIFGLVTGVEFVPVQLGISGATINMNILQGNLTIGNPQVTVVDTSGNIYGNTITSTGGVAVTGTNGTGTTGLYVGPPGGSLPPGGFGLFTGTVAAYGFSQLSSSAVKNNITILNRKQALKVVMDMEPVTFFYNDDVIISTKAFPEGAGRSTFPNVGFIAQQTENVTRGYNGIITENTVPLKGGRTYSGPGISLPSLIPFAVGAIQDVNLQSIEQEWPQLPQKQSTRTKRCEVAGK